MKICVHISGIGFNKGEMKNVVVAVAVGRWFEAMICGWLENEDVNC